MRLFGLEVRKIRKEEERERKDLVTFAPPETNDGAEIVAAPYTGHFDYSVGLDGPTFKNDRSIIARYRQMILNPDVEGAVEEIANEAIVTDDDTYPVSLNLDDVDVPDKLKDRIREEFTEVLRLLNFRIDGHDIFKKWYVDSRIVYHKIVDESNLKRGLVKVTPIDPANVRKVREYELVQDGKSATTLYRIRNEFYVYQSDNATTGTTTPRISPDAICFVTSGLFDETLRPKRIIGYLHRAIKPANQLAMMEDSSVIYRLSRAPERRVFYIDVGTLPKTKAEEYLRSIMAMYRNKLVYDASTGDIKDDRRHMTVMDDFWLPRREGGRGTEISTLPGGENLGKIEDIEYFRKKLYKSLFVPFGRIDDGDASRFSLGRSSEITRDEVRFSRFINRLRNRFSFLFVDLLRTQLVLKNVMLPEEWADVVERVRFDYNEDNYFTEFKRSEILRERADTLQRMDPYIGKYYSRDWVRKNILSQNDEEIRQIEKEIAEDEKRYGKPEEDQRGGGFR